MNKHINVMPAFSNLVDKLVNATVSCSAPHHMLLAEEQERRRQVFQAAKKELLDQIEGSMDVFVTGTMNAALMAAEYSNKAAAQKTKLEETQHRLDASEQEVSRLTLVVEQQRVALEAEKGESRRLQYAVDTANRKLDGAAVEMQRRVNRAYDDYDTRLSERW